MPTPLLDQLTRGLPLRGETLPLEALRDPAAVALLDTEDIAALRDMVVRRLRENGRYLASLRNIRVGDSIPIPPDFDTSQLSDGARAALHAYLDGAPLQSVARLSWADVIGSRRRAGGRANILGALAEFEAVLSSVPHADAGDAARRALERLVDDVRLDGIRADDLRFGWRHFGDAPSLSRLLKGWLASDQALDARQQAYVERVERAMAFTLAQDIEDIARTLAQRAFINQVARARCCEALAARFGARDFGPELEAIGKRLGCSPAQVSNNNSAALRARQAASVFSPAAEALNRVREQFEFLPTAQLEEKLGLGRGSGDSLATFRRFCMHVLRPAQGFDLGVHRALNEMQEGVAARYGKASSLQAALRYAQRECRISGAANLTTVAGSLVLDGRAASREALERWVDDYGQAQWLDRDRGWFVLRDHADSLIRARVLKLLAVAREPVSMREIGEALWRSADLTFESGGEAALAPLPILKAAMLTWPDGVREAATGFVELRQPLDPATVLSPLEYEAYRTLAARGGISAGTDIARELGKSTGATHARVQYAPFIWPLGHGIFALRGWPIAPRDMLAALAQQMAGAAQSNQVVVIESR